MSKSLDRLTLLATFARIAERGSISAAARDVGLSQASASRQLAELEARVGAQLVRRTTHALSLTEQGREVLSAARGLLAGWEALCDQAAGGDAIRGKLKVVAPLALGQVHLVRAAIAFQQAHPDLAITWLLDDAPIRFAEIGCDLWIRIGRPDDDRLIVKEVGSVERLIVAAPALLEGAAIASPEDLTPLPAAALSPFENTAVRLRHRDGTRAVISARAVMTTNTIFSAREAARLGVGYAVMPRWFVREDLDRGALVDVLPAWRAAPMTITASYLPAGRQPRRLTRFTEHMIATIGAIDGVASP